MAMFQRDGDVARVARLFCTDEGGADLIEYALLTGIVTVGAILLFANVGNTLQTAYINRNTAAQNAWEPCPPQPATCPTP
jgi:Flp pilus assembly pilin Flp